MTDRESMTDKDPETDKEPETEKDPETDKEPEIEKRLETAKEPAPVFSTGKALPLGQSNIHRRYKSASWRLFFLDYDGTLTPIISDPAAALLDSHTVEILGALAQQSKNTIWIISGRDQKFLGEQFDAIPYVGLVAEHGAFIRYPGEILWTDVTKEISTDWMDIVTQEFADACKVVRFSRVEIKKAAVVWHYRDSDQEEAEEKSKELRAQIQDKISSFPIKLMEGKCVLEAKLDYINKGSMVKKLMEEFELNRGGTPDFVLGVGDDTTDEDMFYVLKRAFIPYVYPILVGQERTKLSMADWFVEDVACVVKNLALLAQSEA